MENRQVKGIADTSVGNPAQRTLLPRRRFGVRVRRIKALLNRAQS